MRVSHFALNMYVCTILHRFATVVVKMQELRDIATTEAAKGKHFFLETDIKGPGLKLDNTGKAILTVSYLVIMKSLIVLPKFIIGDHYCGL